MFLCILMEVLRMPRACSSEASVEDGDVANVPDLPAEVVVPVLLRLRDVRDAALHVGRREDPAIVGIENVVLLPATDSP